MKGSESQGKQRSKSLWSAYGVYVAVTAGALLLLVLLLTFQSTESQILYNTSEIKEMIGGSRSSLELCRLEVERLRQGKGEEGGSASCDSERERAATAAKALLSCESDVSTLRGKQECPPCMPCRYHMLGAGQSLQEAGALREEVQQLRAQVAKLTREKLEMQGKMVGGVEKKEIVLSQESMEKAQELLAGCDAKACPAVNFSDGGLTSWKGYKCQATEDDMKRYLDYTPRQLCPHDWYFVQRLIFQKDCFALPRRRCLTRTPAQPKEPLPRPESLFSQEGLADSNVRWDLHQCKSFECLNTRVVGDCRNCFNMTLESHRWLFPYRGSLAMKEVIDLKAGSLRLGLDCGGGTGSFAAHMALHNVTVLTTAYNIETVPGSRGGLPYMETIALRGLVPLHWPHKARLPFYDATFDIIHSVNSIKYIPPVEYEELIFEWDRILRAGGLLWFEMFYAPVEEMPIYVGIVDLLGYKRLYWNFTPKPDGGEKGGAHVYLNCILEKPVRPGKGVLNGPNPEDMDP